MTIRLTHLSNQVQIWDIFENKHLFEALDEERQYSPSHHVAEMVGYLGLPPLHFLQRSEETRNVFDKIDRSGCVEISRRMARHEDLRKHSDDEMCGDDIIHELIT